MRNFILLFSLFCWVVMSAACADDKLVSPEIKPFENTVVFSQNGGKEEIKVVSNTEWKVSIIPEEATWCKASRFDQILQISVEENKDCNERSVTLNLYCDGLSVPVKVEQLGTEPALKLDKKTLNVAGNVFEASVKVTSNIDYNVNPDEQWIKVKPETEARDILQTKIVRFVLDRNTTGAKRNGTITFLPANEAHKSFAVTLKIIQGFSSMDANDISDRKITIKSATANQQEQNQTPEQQDIKSSFDGNASTFYHSPWSSGKTTFPVVLTFYLEQEEDMDYLIYTPRQDSNNGAWGKVDIEFAYNGNNTSFSDKIEGDFGQQPKTARKFDFGSTKAGVTAIRFTVKNALNNLVTCAEMGLYQKSNIDEVLKEIFADELCTQLKPGVGEEQIDKIQSPFLKELARNLYNGVYNNEYISDFRVQQYLPYRPINDLQKELKINGYNQFENPTGVFFRPDEDAVIFVDNTNNEQLALKVYDFYNRSLGEKRDTEVYPLSKGINVFKVQQGGLAYIDYFTSNYKTAQPIKIHIASGQVNGYYEKNKTTLDWQTLMNNAEYGHFDLKGEKVNMCFPVWEEGGLRQYCKNPDKLIEIYDKYIGMEHEMMGLNKYNRKFTNHMFIRTVPGSPGAAAFADGWGVGVYNNDTDGFNDETCAIKKLWMITHEFGHVNQVRPDLLWVGLGEVTNNCYAICIRHEEIPWYEKMEDEKYNDGRGTSVPGGLLNAFINQHMLNKDAQWIISNTDAFIRLCPLWQLLSYYRYVKGSETIPGKGGLYKDWYGDLIEDIRKSNSSNQSNGQLQIAFMKRACDVLQTNLTEFFENAGMLRPCDARVEDYASGQLTITQADCDNLKKYATKYKKPAAALNYMSANAIRAYKEERPVTGIFNQGISVSGNRRTISHSIWQNAVAFETYAGAQLKYVAVMGTGCQTAKSLEDIQPIKEKPTTEVYYPNGSTAIYAVAWNGQRTLVYGNSNGMENKN